jgi:hypothetical protein
MSYYDTQEFRDELRWDEHRERTFEAAVERAERDAGIDVDPRDMSRREIIGLIVEYDRAREKEKAAGEERKEHGDNIKAWLVAHPEEEEGVEDGEHRLRAKLQFRSTGEVIPIAKLSEETLVALARAGAVKIDVKAVERIASENVAAARAMEHRRRGGTSTALIVESF